jgi:hypothetical protein
LVKKVYPRLERSQEVESESQGGGGRMPGGGKGTKLSGTVGGKPGGECAGVTGKSRRGDERRLMLGGKLCSMPVMPGAKLGGAGWRDTTTIRTLNDRCSANV